MSRFAGGFRCLLAVGCLSMMAAQPGRVLVAETTSAKCFRVFDGTMYSGKPDLRAPGFEPALVPDAERWWAPNQPKDRLPDQGTVQSWVRRHSGAASVLVIDLEWWPIQGNPAAVTASVARYGELAQWARSASRGGAIGFYGVPPIRDYWRAIQDPGSADYRQWQSENDALAPIVRRVDALFPSLYTFYDDEPGWERYAIANLREARRLAGSKPVYAFLWPQYHDSNARLGLKYVPAAAWARELQTVRRHADGVVIWGGWDFANRRPAAWSDAAPWWREVRSLLSQPGVCNAPAAIVSPRVNRITEPSRRRLAA